MKLPRRTWLLHLAALPAGLALAAWPAAAQTGTTANPLAPLAHWVGGEWVGTLTLPDGRKLTLLRHYQWSFDQQLITVEAQGADGRWGPYGSYPYRRQR